ncbi:MAG: DUF459 domain-containing protein [Deltaproteobacteria bacterium]|jgi:S-formylglutathione hydrolase FrmB|nr:DUF459 domain-containing protein [Deltaproteobacteria bacterium]
MRFRRKGLTPAKSIAVYFLALLLVLVHESNRLADWLADAGRSGPGPVHNLALNLAAELKAAANRWGITALNEAEGRLLNHFKPEADIGSFTRPSGDESQLREPVPAAAVTEMPGRTAVSPAEPQNPPAQTPAPTETAPPLPLEIPSEIPLNPSPAKPVFKNILLTGDSMMLEGIGPPLQKLLAGLEGVTVSREGRYATGLCRLDVFDWFAYFKGLLEQKKPDLVIITLGANDTQDIVEDKKRHQVTTDSWRKLYGQRVTRLLELARETNSQIFWIGLPVMGREPYNTRTLAINQVTEAACREASNCRFYDTWTILADSSGKYTTFLNQGQKHLRVRAKDLIHLTETGGQIMAESFLKASLDWALLGQSAPEADQAVQEDSSVQEMRLLTQARAIAESLPQSPAESRFEPQAVNPVTAALSPVSAPVTAISDPAGQSAGPPETPLSDNPAAAADTLVEVTLKSKALGKDTRYLVYTPQDKGLYPAVFLLPGTEENYQAWAEHFGTDLWTLAEKYRLNLIMIDGDGFGWYLDSPVNKNSQHMTYFFDELMPDVLNKFPLQNDKLALMGISMGGHGALTLALARPGRFKAVSAMSAVTDIAGHGGEGALNDYLRLEEVLGSYKQFSDRWRKASAYWQTRQNPGGLAQTPVYLTVGLSDRLVLAENRQYNRLLTELKLPHEYREDSGGHDWSLWGRELPDHLEFLARHLK